MASAEATELFACTPGQFFQIIGEYSKYPEFLQEVKECKILKEEGNRKLVEYTVSMIKNFKYTLWMTEIPSTQISWEFASGDIFKSMSGFWKIKDEGGKARATYFLDASFGMLVPGPIQKALVSVNLPNMISAYHKRVQNLYGR